MKVFKFGGASIKDPQAVRNMGHIISKHEDDALLVVVSAMGKNTNALEKVLQLKIDKQSYQNALEQFFDFHQQLCIDLFDGSEHSVFQQIKQLKTQMESLLGQRFNHSTFNQHYDQLVCFGELFSSYIVYHYLKSIGLSCQWIDAGDYIKTDQNFREGKVNWPVTESLIQEKMRQSNPQPILITQGFIASDDHGHPTTLGREGSDYTAAVFAYCLDAPSVTIWKDVPGVLNADPKSWPETKLLAELSYDEAAEMTYYGASVIHPKTIKPLANKEIPLFVRSFQNPDTEGTQIHLCHHPQLPPAIIFKPCQCLISFQVRDFTFINERKLSQIFHLLEELNLKINMMQSSAITFSICVDSIDDKIKTLINSLSHEFEIHYNDHLELITVKNYNRATVDQVKKGRTILLEQQSRKNFQILTTVNPDTV